MFSRIAMQGFGGVVSLMQREVVEKQRWLSHAEFLDEWSMAQVMPGSNVVNFALVLGNRFFGVRGAMAAMTGFLCGPTLLMACLAMIYRQVAEWVMVQAALQGLGVATAAMIAAAGIKMLPAVSSNVLGWRHCLALMAAVAVALLIMHWPLPWIVLVSALWAWAWAAVAVRKADRATPHLPPPSATPAAEGSDTRPASIHELGTRL